MPCTHRTRSPASARPANKTILLLANGLMAKRGLRKARASAGDEVMRPARVKRSSLPGPRARPSAMREFDPRRVGREECAAWVTYYRREWVRSCAPRSGSPGTRSACRGPPGAVWRLARAARQPAVGAVSPTTTPTAPAGRWSASTGSCASATASRSIPSRRRGWRSSGGASTASISTARRRGRRGPAGRRAGGALLLRIRRTAEAGAPRRRAAGAGDAPFRPLGAARAVTWRAPLVRRNGRRWCARTRRCSPPSTSSERRGGWPPDAALGRLGLPPSAARARMARVTRRLRRGGARVI